MDRGQMRFRLTRPAAEPHLVRKNRGLASGQARLENKCREQQLVDQKSPPNICMSKAPGRFPWRWEKYLHSLGQRSTAEAAWTRVFEAKDARRHWNLICVENGRILQDSWRTFPPVLWSPAGLTAPYLVGQTVQSEVSAEVLKEHNE